MPPGEDEFFAFLYKDPADTSDIEAPAAVTVTEMLAAERAAAAAAAAAAFDASQGVRETHPDDYQGPDHAPPYGDYMAAPTVPKRRLSIVFAAAEVAPWSKTGGLGDVMGALPQALASQGHRVMVVAPRYLNEANKKAKIYEGAEDTGVSLKLDLHKGGVHDITYYHEMRDGVDFVFVDHLTYKRPGTPYGTAEGPFADNLLRFSILSMAAVEAPLNLPLPDHNLGRWQQMQDWAVEQGYIKVAAPPKAPEDYSPVLEYGQNVVFVANDWHTALVPVYIKSRLQPFGVYKNAQVALALHNTAHQGESPAAAYAGLGLPAEWFTTLEWLEPVKKVKTINILKVGVGVGDGVGWPGGGAVGVGVGLLCCWCRWRVSAALHSVCACA